MPLIQTVQVDLSELYGDDHDPHYFAKICPPEWLPLERVAMFEEVMGELGNLGDTPGQLLDPEFRKRVEDIFRAVIVTWNLTVAPVDDEGNELDGEIELAPPRRDRTSIWQVPMRVLLDMVGEASKAINLDAGGEPGATIPLENESPLSALSTSPEQSLPSSTQDSQP